MREKNLKRITTWECYNTSIETCQWITNGQIWSELGLLSISKTCKRSYCQSINYHPHHHHLFWRKTSEGNLGRSFKSFTNQIPFRNPTSQKTLESETIPPPCHRPTFQLLNKIFFQGILSSWRDPGCHYHCTASLQQKLGLLYIHPYLEQQQIKWLTNCKHNKSCSWKQLRYCV